MMTVREDFFVPGQFAPAFVLKQLYIKCRGLGRNAGSLEIRMGNADCLPRTEGAKTDGIAETVGDGCGISNHISRLGIDVTWISGVKKTVVAIYPGNSSGGCDGRGSGGASLRQNKKGSGLGRNAPGHPGGKKCVNPHSFPDAAETDTLPRSVHNYSISVKV